MRLIAERENEIKAFNSEEYWILDALLENVEKECFKATYWGTKKKTNLPNQQTVDAIIAQLKNNPYSVKAIKESQKKRKPSAPFTTSTLQQDASSKLGFSAQKTMSVAQQLYEGVEVEGEGTVGLITYLRTDSVRIAEEALTEVRELIGNTYGEKYLPDQANVYKTKKNAQDAHEAIRPTVAWRAPDQIKASLSRDQLKLYTLIYNRFIASQMTPVIFANKVIDIVNGDHMFKANGSTKIFDGYTVMYKQAESGDANTTQLLPHVEEGEKLALDKLDPQQKFTQPPSRYTEAALVKMLEELGIGRPSTYAPTISTIVSRGYVEREKRTLFPTELGMIVNELMTTYFNQVVDYEFTAKMEENLDKVAEGDMQWQQVLEGFYPVLEQLLEEADKKIERIKIEDEESDQVCEKCGAQMVIKRGRFGKFIACPNFPECKNTKPLVEDVGALCPDCGGKIIARKSKKGRRFYGCDNYPECKFISWYLPSKEKCPKCGKYMVIKQNKTGKVEQCSEKECGYSRILED
jgi:DNA topoisomerase-1